MWNQQPSQPQLPFPYQQVIQTAWIHSPETNPPNVPVQGPPPVQGAERNVVGALIAFLQNQSGVSPIRCFSYNLISRDQYNNKEFADLLNSVLLLTGALIESNQFQRVGEAAHFAVERLVMYNYINIAKQFPALQDLDPQMGEIAGEVEQIGRELGNMVAGYQQHLQSQAAQHTGWGNVPSGGGSMPWNNGGGAPANSRRWGNDVPAGASPWNAPAASSAQNPWGNGPATPSARFDQRSQQTGPGQPNVDVFDPVLKQHPKPTNKETRGKPMQASAFLDAEPVAPRKELKEPGARTRGGRVSETLATAPRPTNSPTGNTVDMKPRGVEVQQTGDSDDERWVMPHEVGSLWVPTWTEERPHKLLIDAEYNAFAYRQKGDRIFEFVFEKGETMPAGYELHELAMRSQHNHLDAPIKATANAVYHRDEIVKVPTEDKVSDDLIPVTNFNYTGGGRIGSHVLLTIQGMREKHVDDPKTVVAYNYGEEMDVLWDTDPTAYFDGLRDSKTLAEVAAKLGTLSHTGTWGTVLNWVNRVVTSTINEVLSKDYELSFTVDDFLDDHKDLVKLLNDRFSEAFAERVEARILYRSWLNMGQVNRTVPESDEELAMVVIQRQHRIIDVPLTLDQLTLRGVTNRGLITHDSAPVVHRILEKTMDGYTGLAWLSTVDGSLLEVRPNPLRDNQWLLVPATELA